MRKILVDSIKGNEILAKDIVSNNGIIIISAGKKLKKEYSNRLKQLDIDYIYVVDKQLQQIEVQKNTETIIVENFQNIIKDIVENFSYQSIAEVKEISEIVQSTINEILKQKEVLYSISGIREKSESTYYHCVNVCALSILLSIKLKIPKKKIKEIAIGSLLHDIGYTYIPFENLQCEYGKCSKKEEKELMKHVIYGYSSLMDKKWISSFSKDIILNHHERLDGTGFPFHKQSEKITLQSKIVAICDTFDSLVYGYLTPRKKVHEAIPLIVKDKGIKFDEKIVNIFQTSIAAYPNGTMVVTSNGDIGIVIKQNINNPKRPVIHMIEDKYGNKYTNWMEKDLSKEKSLSIWDTVED